MHCSGPLPLTFEGLEQGFGGKNYQNGSLGKPCFVVTFNMKHLEMQDTSNKRSQ